MKRGKEDWAEKRAHRIVNTRHDLNDAYNYIARALRTARRMDKAKHYARGFNEGYEACMKQRVKDELERSNGTVGRSQ